MSAIPCSMHASCAQAYPLQHACFHARNPCSMRAFMRAIPCAHEARMLLGACKPQHRDHRTYTLRYTRRLALRNQGDGASTTQHHTSSIAERYPRRQRREIKGTVPARPSTTPRPLLSAIPAASAEKSRGRCQHAPAPHLAPR